MNPDKDGHAQRENCKHCGLRIYFDDQGPLRKVWRHHGSNFDACFGGRVTFAEPQKNINLSPNIEGAKGETQ